MSSLSPAQLQQRIRHEDEGVLVVDKPHGLPTSGRQLKDPDCLQYVLMQRQVAMVWAVHQLDADTSGLNVFVKRRALVPVWQERLRFPNARKRYLALVEGQPAAQRIEAPIGEVLGGANPRLGVAPDGRRAATQLRPLATAGGVSLCELSLETGRTHQIRIHLQHIGHPLLGEAWYRPQPCRRHPRQALHAWRLDFEDAGLPGALCADLPGDLRGLCDELGLPQP